MLTLADVEERLGLTRGQINHYVVTGLISDVAEKVGTGRSRTFSQINLLEFALVMRLVQYGFTYAEVREILTHLRGTYPPLRSEKHQRQSPARPVLVVVNRRYAMIQSYGDIKPERLLRQGAKRSRPFQSILLINLEAELAAIAG